MRMHTVVASFTLAAALTACGRQDTPTATATKTTQPAAPALDLAGAPKVYQRMRFVSELEQSRSSVPLHSPEHARHFTRSTASHRGATQASLASLVTRAPVAMAVASAASAAPSVAVAATQAAPPMSMPAEVATEFGAERGHVREGFSGGVMIRGGVGPNGKCDPRSDAQAAGILAGRPNSAMPLMPSSPVFGRR